MYPHGWLSIPPLRRSDSLTWTRKLIIHKQAPPTPGLGTCRRHQILFHYVTLSQGMTHLLKCTHTTSQPGHHTVPTYNRPLRLHHLERLQMPNDTPTPLASRYILQFPLKYWLLTHHIMMVQLKSDIIVQSTFLTPLTKPVGRMTYWLQVDTNQSTADLTSAAHFWSSCVSVQSISRSGFRRIG